MSMNKERWREKKHTHIHFLLEKRAFSIFLCISNDYIFIHIVYSICNGKIIALGVLFMLQHLFKSECVRMYINTRREFMPSKNEYINRFFISMFVCSYLFTYSIFCSMLYLVCSISLSLLCVCFFVQLSCSLECSAMFGQIGKRLDTVSQKCLE